jgi:hypothetical protein
MNDVMPVTVSTNEKCCHNMPLIPLHCEHGKVHFIYEFCGVSTCITFEEYWKYFPLKGQDNKIKARLTS